MPQCPACNQSVAATAVNCPHCNIPLNLQQSAVSPKRDASGLGIVVVEIVGALALLSLLAGVAVFAVASPSVSFSTSGSTSVHVISDSAIDRNFSTASPPSLLPEAGSESPPAGAP